MNSIRPERTQEVIYKQLKEGNFMTVPGDVYILKHTSNVISDSLTIELINKRDDEQVIFGLPNNIKSWQFLKGLNEIGNRIVLYQIDEEEPFPFEESTPYKYRFDSNFRKDYNRK